MSDAPAEHSPLTLGPRGLERPADAGHTNISVLDDRTPGSLDLGGGFAPWGAGVMLDWWVGGDDRWYLPSRETTIRQRRLGAGPVIETAMRIPSGDAVHRCYAVASPQGSATVIEIHNASPVPVAIAIAVRPYGLDGQIGDERSMTLDGDRVLVDGEPVLILPRRPNEAQASADTDVVDRLVAGGALTGPTSATGSAANLAVLYPLPHTTTLTFVVPGPQGSVPRHLPDIDKVSSGWTTVIERGGRFVLPDPGLGDRAAAARARLLAASVEVADRVAALEPGAGRLLEALATSGADRECQRALAELAPIFPVRLSHAPAAGAGVVRGAAAAAAILQLSTAAESLLEPLMQITHLVERSGDRVAAAEALAGLAEVLRVVGQNDAARRVAASIPTVGHVDDVPADLGALTELSEQGSSVGSWEGDDVLAAARFWLGVRRQLVDDSKEDLVMLADFPTAWRGGNFEIHRAATRHGALSFAIRWHGARPALLWELDRAAGDPVRLRCPGLDPDWHTTERRGETLLAGSTEELPMVPGEGDSFS